MPKAPADHPDGHAGGVGRAAQPALGRAQYPDATVEIQASVMKTQGRRGQGLHHLPRHHPDAQAGDAARLRAGSGDRHARLRHGQRRQELHPLHSLQEQGRQGLQLPEEEIGQPDGEHAAGIFFRCHGGAGAGAGRSLCGDCGYRNSGRRGQEAPVYGARNTSSASCVPSRTAHATGTRCA